MTQAQLAERLGITVRQYNAVENGTTDSTLKVWTKIKDVLGGTLDDLVKNDSTR